MKTRQSLLRAVNLPSPVAAFGVVATLFLSACNPVSFRSVNGPSGDVAPSKEEATAPTEAPVVAAPKLSSTPSPKTLKPKTLKTEAATQPMEQTEASVRVPIKDVRKPAVVAPVPRTAPAKPVQAKAMVPSAPLPTKNNSTSAPGDARKDVPALASTPQPLPIYVARAQSAEPSGNEGAGVAPERAPASVESGTCDGESRLLSCMACPAAKSTTTEPQLSAKGAALLDILERGCAVTNGSDPADYVAPTRAELLARMNRLSDVFYPDSPMSTRQESTLKALRSDANEIKKTFGGVFYSGVTPESIAFETYFGISTIEARYSFCYAFDGEQTVGSVSLSFTREGSNPINSKEYWNCLYDREPTTCRESADYVNANVYRDQLRRGLTESVVNPFKAVTTSAQTCQWAKLDTRMGDDAVARVESWIANGYVIAADVPSEGVCKQVRSVADIQSLPTGTDVAFAGYRCK